MSDWIITYAVLNERDQIISTEYQTEQAAINDAQARNANGSGQFAVCLLKYEYIDSMVIWTPDGLNQWPPPSDAELTIGTNGEFRFQCPTGLCNHLFNSDEIVPGGTLDCPECGSQLRIAEDGNLLT